MTRAPPPNPAHLFAPAGEAERRSWRRRWNVDNDDAVRPTWQDVRGAGGTLAGWIGPHGQLELAGDGRRVDPARLAAGGDGYPELRCVQRLKSLSRHGERVSFWLVRGGDRLRLVHDWHGQHWWSLIERGAPRGQGSQGAAGAGLDGMELFAAGADPPTPAPDGQPPGR